MTETQIYVLTRSAIFRVVWYMLLVQLFCKTKVVANLQLEADQNSYEIAMSRKYI
jgi:hypothetical protein